MTRTIPLKIQNEYITGDKVLIGAAGSHNDVVLRMEFSPLWEGLTKTVQFRDALGETTIEVLLTADMLEADDTSVYLVPVPNGAKKYAGEMTLCVKGAAVAGGKETRATTAVYGRFTVGESKWSADAETEQDVPPTQAEQLQGQIENVLATIVDARKAATEAEKSAEGAALSQSRAQTSEQYAGEYAQGAANSAASASSSATAAASSATAAKASEGAAAGSATNASASATSAGKSASAASNSAGLASGSAAAAKTSETNAKRSETSAAGSAAAADNSEKKAAAAATKAEAASNHPPRINSNGKWELWDFDNSRYVATIYDAQGPKGDTGATGATGAPGAAAGFGTPSAAVDANVGTPSVQISTSGPDTAKVFAFTFRNLKGDKGESGDSYTVLGLYGTLLALQAAHPTGGAGQAWFVGTADDNVVYQWDVDKSQWVNVGPLKGPKGDKGDPGSPGANGAPGTAATIQVGSVSSGTTAGVTNSGTSTAAVFDFVLPKGDKGEKGAAGDPGAKGDPGAAGKSAYASAQDGGYTGTETQFNSDLAKIGNKADKSETVTGTLLAASWTGEAAPYTYTLSVSGVTATSNQEVLPALNITAEQLEALQGANIQDGGQAANSMTLKAYGDKPTIDLPIRVIKRGD